MQRYPELTNSSRKAIGFWLFVVAALVGAMTVIGGITRLTESGLSMVEWRPLVGWLPPLNDGEWARVFDLYRASPEYQKINAGMSLSEFQAIFWWEFVHRVWGRLIGLAFAGPLVVFWIKGWIVPSLRGRLLFLLALGGLQGLIGWWMVKSGLVDRPDVSHYRLAVHLAMAFLIAGLLVWTAFDVLWPRPPRAVGGRCVLAHVVAAAVFFAVVLGAFVAGTNAGMIYNHFPWMGAGLAPPDYLFLDPWWRNPLENPAAIQFNHRWAGMLAAVLAFLTWLLALSDPPLDPCQRRAAGWLALAAGAQISLGVATLLTVVWTPLAAMHQAMALLAFLAAVRTLWAFRGEAGP